MLIHLNAGSLASAIAILVGFFGYVRAEQWSPLQSTSSSCDDFLEEFRWLVESANLSLARRKGLEELHHVSPDICEKNDIAKAYIATFRESYDLEGNEYLRRIEKSIDAKAPSTLRAKTDSTNCKKTYSDWDTIDIIELWDASCSILPVRNKKNPSQSSLSFGHKSSFGSSFHTECCEFTPGCWTYLRLPVIQEPVIRLRIPYHEINDSREEQTPHNIILNLEQDGYLRPFDVGGILWPTGYLLSLCLGDVFGCPIPELTILVHQYQRDMCGEKRRDGVRQSHFPLAIELGAGIGASSIALARSLQRVDFFSPSSQDTTPQPWVVATDVAPHALALTIANAKNNGVDLDVMLMDHFNRSSMYEVKKKYFPEALEEVDLSLGRAKENRRKFNGFSLVFGSSLQGLFEETDRRNSKLWTALDELIEIDNPNALAVFVHNRADPIKIPTASDFPYRVLRRLSGSDEAFGNMKTRAGDTSDFEICVIQRKPTPHGETFPSLITRETGNTEL